MRYVMTTKRATHPLHEQLAVLADHAPGEPDLPETNVAVHLLRVLRVERAPPAAHLEQQHAERPEVDELAVPVLVQQDQAEAKQNVETRLEFIRGEM